MSKRVKLSLLTGSVVLVLCIFLGLNAPGVRAAGESGTEGAYRQVNVYGEVLQHVQNDYVEEPNIPLVTNGALRGMLESLDADSSYLSPADYRAYKADRGGKAQVGLYVSKRGGYATVVSVVPGSPADKAEIGDGDLIEFIGKQDTRDLSLAMVQLLLQGSPGSELQMSVIRPRKTAPEKVTLNRVVLSEPPVAETFYDNASILYLRPQILDREHVNQVEAKLKNAGKAGGKKVLLDLRDVAAGDDAEAVRMANFFLKDGTIATLEGQKVPKQTFTAEPGKVLDVAAPLVVLINRGTSGPAEIVAAAVADNKRGQLVGERSFGEGSQQKTFELPDGGAIILSVAKYASPAGKKFEDDAVVPGVLVASAQDNGPEDDATADKATPHATPASSAPDEQLNKALDLLKGKSA